METTKERLTRLANEKLREVEGEGRTAGDLLGDLRTKFGPLAKVYQMGWLDTRFEGGHSLAYKVEHPLFRLGLWVNSRSWDYILYVGGMEYGISRDRYQGYLHRPLPAQPRPIYNAPVDILTDAVVEFLTTAGLDLQKDPDQHIALTKPREEPLPDYGDLFSLREWWEARERGIFIPDDGSGQFATEEVVFPDTNAFDDTTRPDNATHVAWFNK